MAVGYSAGTWHQVPYSVCDCSCRATGTCMWRTLAFSSRERREVKAFISSSPDEHAVLDRSSIFKERRREGEQRVYMLCLIQSRKGSWSLDWSRLLKLCVITPSKSGPLSYFQIDARHRPYIFADYEQLMNQEDENSSILLLVTVITVILKLATLPTLKVNIVLDPF